MFSPELNLQQPEMASFWLLLLADVRFIIMKAMAASFLR
jgi:hypothetical protein